MKSLLAFLFLASLAQAALADGATLYKWTDAQGVIHYSDQPPVQPAADLQSTDMPSFPVQDPAQIAAHQAQLVAQAQAAQKLLQAQLEQQAELAALAAQQAALEAELADQQQAASQSVPEPIYVNSAFVPRAYRANLYVPHFYHDSHRTDTVPSRPAIAVLHKPR